MRYVKLFGLVTVAAAALMAFVGAGTAFAVTESVLCKATETPHCASGNVYPEGTEIEAETIATPEIVTEGGVKHPAATNATLTGAIKVHCDSKIKGTLSSKTTPSGTVEKANLTWSNCTPKPEVEEVVTVTGGTITVHHDAEHNGTVTIEGITVTLRVSGIHCNYTGNVTGTLTGSATEPIIHVTAPVTRTDTPDHTSSFFCPKEPNWHATYKVTKPTPLYVGTEGTET